MSVARVQAELIASLVDEFLRIHAIGARELVRQHCAAMGYVQGSIEYWNYMELAYARVNVSRAEFETNMMKQIGAAAA